MKKWFLLFLMGVLILTTTSGCKQDDMDGIKITTTSYPIEYITERLYGEHAIIQSIYPDGTDIRKHKSTKKQLLDYSKTDLFIYNGLSDEKEIAFKLLDQNPALRIIDSTSVLETTYGVEELWLNPSHLLMISQNIKQGLDEYVESVYLQKEIEDYYEQLKVDLSSLDAEYRLAADNAAQKKIIVSSDVLKCLEKYGLTVISLDHNTENLAKNVDDAILAINNKEVSYIFLLEYEEASEEAKAVIEQTGASAITFRRLDNITDQERDDHEDYLTIMNQNLDNLKKELYQ